MKLSTKCRYGTRAIIEIASHFTKNPIKRKIISKNQEIPDSYLENILIALKIGGLIQTIRGSKGGYILAKPPEEITLLRIINSLEGSLSPVDCIDNPVLCNRIKKCITRDIWIKMKHAQEDILKNITIADLLKNKHNCVDIHKKINTIEGRKK